jgi:hypothetical protein
MTYRGVAAAAAPPTVAQGKIYFDSTANKFKVSENNGAYVDLLGSGGGAMSAITAAAGTNSINNLNHAQTWNWNTLSSQTALTLSSSSVTSGSILSIKSTHDSATSNGSLIYLSTTGADNQTSPISISQAGGAYVKPSINIETDSGNAISILNTNDQRWSAIAFNTHAGVAAGWVGYGNINAPSQADQVYIEAAGTKDIAFWSNDLQRAVIDGATGNVGIGTTSPQTTLQVAGVISPSVNNTYTLGNATYRFTEVYATNGVINTSDRREKKDISDTDLGLDFINRLRPVSYRWNTGVDSDVHYGLIAQEAEQAIADTGRSEKTSIVTHDEKTDRYGVRYSELISPLIKAVQELYRKIVGIEAQQNAQERKIAELESRAQKAEQENAAIKAYLCSKEKNAAICPP